jgi:hypothetical protein
MPNLHGLTVDLGWGLAAEMVLALAVVATVFWMCSRSVALEYALAAGVTGGLLVSHHAYLHDTCVLVFVFAALRSAVAGISLRLLALIVLPPVYLIAILDGVRAQGNMLLVALLLATLGSLLIVKRPALTAETVDALVTTGS